MIKSTKSVNVTNAVPARTANSLRLERITINFLRKRADARISLGQDDGSTFVPISVARLSLDLPDVQAGTVRTSLETTMKKVLSEKIGFTDTDTSVVDR